MMRMGSKRTAFTLIELLVVVAIIALLLSILLPSLSGAREQGKKAKCLANLKNLGASMYQYSTDDKAEQLIPIHMRMVSAGTPYWLWRTVNWFAWGGNSGKKVFRESPDAGFILDDTSNGLEGQVFPEYAGYRRPLNVYMDIDVGGYEDRQEQRLEQFECPSDTGYPDDINIDDAPRANAERSCYETMGNSYRASLAMTSLVSMGGRQPSAPALSVSAWGHRASTLVDTGNMALAGEPTFFNMIGRDDDEAGEISPEVPVYGWHKRKLMDNVLFCDASARLTKAERELELLDDDANKMGVDPLSRALITRASTYRLDCYPIGGAVIFGAEELAGRLGRPGWPWRGYQDNLRASGTLSD